MLHNVPWKQTQMMKFVHKKSNSYSTCRPYVFTYSGMQGACIMRADMPKCWFTELLFLDSPDASGVQTLNLHHLWQVSKENAGLSHITLHVSQVFAALPILPAGLPNVQLSTHNLWQQQQNTSYIKTPCILFCV